MNRKRDFHLLERTIYQIADFKIHDWRGEPANSLPDGHVLIMLEEADRRFSDYSRMPSGRWKPRLAEIVSSKSDVRAYHVCVDGMVREVSLGASYVSPENLQIE